MNKNAIKNKWECSSCGNILEKSQVLTTNTKGTKFSFESPKACGCGEKEAFKLLEFEQMNSIIVNEKQMKEIEKILEK